jgi:hypothetical protein
MSNSSLRILWLALLFPLLFAPACTTSKTTSIQLENPVDIRTQALDYILQGKLEAAINLFSEEELDVKSELLEQLKAADAKYKLGTIEYEDWSVEHNKINYKLYEYLPAGKGEITYLPKDKLFPILDQDKIDEALDLAISCGYEDIILTKARLERAKRAYQSGNISVEELNVNFARIKYAMKYFWGERE